MDTVNNYFGDEICAYMDVQGSEFRAVLGPDEIYQRRWPRCAVDMTD